MEPGAPGQHHPEAVDGAMGVQVLAALVADDVDRSTDMVGPAQQHELLGAGVVCGGLAVAEGLQRSRRLVNAAFDPFQQAAKQPS